MLNKIKTLLGISDDSKDDLLEVLISQTEAFVADFIHTDTEGCEPLIIDLVILRYNRLGTEGLNSESYSGVSFSYNDLPDNLYKQLVARRKIRVI